MKITYLGQNSIWIETGSHKILFDPFITPNELAAHIRLEDFVPDYIILTHAHGDHVADVEKLASMGKVKLISNAEIAGYYSKKGIETTGMNTGGSAEFPFGKLSCVVAHHSSSFPNGSYGGNPNGYILQSGNISVYVAGDTSLTYDMKLIPQLFGKIDLAVLPVGDHFTMDAKAAAIAAEFVQCNKVLGCHYDTFPPIKIDPAKAQSEFRNVGKELVLLGIGESMNL